MRTAGGSRRREQFINHGDVTLTPPRLLSTTTLLVPSLSHPARPVFVARHWSGRDASTERLGLCTCLPPRSSRVEHPRCQVSAAPMRNKLAVSNGRLDDFDDDRYMKCFGWQGVWRAARRGSAPPPMVCSQSLRRMMPPRRAATRDEENG
ncbi:hypothetical protein B0H10DRAFT_2199136 [Mycena sp. CBHHK59/15]|nr:hypothetical protein B0H10DRAFT_2199136 [Mycena sp. CBHHK59/15]